jgi:peptidoglycan/xylan/chitin deacetylase (PgdA/CDA1 family)
MRRKRDPIPRARDAWVWLGGTALLGVLGAGVVAAAAVLWENIDIRQLVPQLGAAAPAGLPLAEEPPRAARDEAPFDLVLFRSPRNQAFFPEAGYYDSALDFWRSLAVDLGARVTVAGSAAELSQAGPEAVLLLAEAPCLAGEEIAAVRAHLRAGGGLVANWAVGARDAECAWRGWQTVAELTGAEDVREMEPRAGLYLTVPAGVPLSPGLDAGTKIELRPDPSLALRLAGPCVYWSDWALNPAPDGSGGGADAAAVSARVPGGGRVAWFGFRHNQAVTATDSLRLRRLLENGFLWAAGTAYATPATWPGGARAALVFALDVEDEFPNALGVASVLRDRGVAGSFYVVSEIVQRDSALAAALSAAGEVGSQTADHAPVAGLTPQDQRFRLRRAVTDIEAWTGAAPVGLHPPEEIFDANTLSAWQVAGGTYIVATNEARSASPEVHRTEDGTVVLLPRILKDDYNHIVQDRVIRASSLARGLMDDVRKLHAIGGLGIVVSHTQIMRSGPRLAVLGAVADSVLAQGDWWIARGEEVAEWWMARAESRISFVERDGSPPAGTQLEDAPIADVVVAAPADRGIEGLWLDLVLPKGPASLLPLVDGRSVDFSETGWGMRVPVPPLPPGGTARVSLVSNPNEPTPTR